MRCLVAAACGLFLSAILSGCGGATVPSAPGDAQPGPPPGTTEDMVKVKPKKA